ncbi:MAG: carboxypeptidase regulatory-like domain-containing protein [Nitrososphaerota archaeon]|nr:carboxypeptidase regulatory-like domain-containing protein [Nitrososphaerota archaeon]
MPRKKLIMAVTFVTVISILAFFVFPTIPFQTISQNKIPNSVSCAASSNETQTTYNYQGLKSPSRALFNFGTQMYTKCQGPLNPYSHSGPATFAVVSPSFVLSNDPQFVQLAEQHYTFKYATPANFSSVKSASFVIIVISSRSDSSYEQLASPYFNGSMIADSFSMGGVTLSFTGIWAPGQTVFVLAGYNPSNLSNALNSFFVQQPVALPHSEFVYVSPTNGSSGDPVLDAQYQGYALNPTDPYFNSSTVYSYYLNFANVAYRAPWSIEEHDVTVEFAFDWNGSGYQLPYSAHMCFISAEPGICYGVYTAIPVFSFSQGNTQSPQVNLDNADCSFLIHCIGVKGNIVSGYSMTYGPGYLAGEKFWAQFAQQYYAPTNYTSLKELMEAGVVLYSTPLANVNPCQYNQCSSTIDFPLGIYPLVTAYSNIEDLDATLGARYNYTSLLEPLTLSTPSTFTNSTGSYAFVQWVVNSEIGNNTYQQIFDSSNATFQVVGPTQAEAIYTPFNPPKPGLLQGKVEFYHTYGSNITGTPINGATINVTQNGNLVFNTTSDANGNYYSPMELQPGCYNITAYRHGYNLEAESTPVCINGNTVDNFYERYYPTFFAYGPAGFGQGITPGNSVNLHFEIYWPDGTPVRNWPVYASVDSGTITFKSNTNNNGIATFKWTGGSTPGDFNASFSVHGIDGTTLFYNMPISVFNASYPLYRLNISVPSQSYSAMTGSSVLIPIQLSGCTLIYPNTGQYVFSCDTGQPPTVDLSVTGLPSGASATITPNHTSSQFSILNLTLSSSVTPGTYKVKLVERGSVAGYYLLPTINSTTFDLNVATCNGMSEISGQVLNRDGNLPMYANVTVYHNGQTVFTQNITSGLFNTGFILPAGTYNVTAYVGTSIYSSQIVNVANCSQTSVTLTPMAELNIGILFNGLPAASANFTLYGPNGFARNLTVNSAGIFNSGYSMMPGSYTAAVYYSGASTTVAFSLTPDNATDVVVIM